MNSSFYEEIKRLKAIAEIGILYATNEYDKERYQELQEMSLRLESKLTGIDLNDLKDNYSVISDYPTPKVDIRGLLLSEDNKILLVKESIDKKWSLPGGWAEIGFSPQEVIIKEFKEETGLDVLPLHLLAVFDKRLHPHPPQSFYVYKMAFYCEATSFEIVKGFDVLDVDYFSIDQLPELSEDRILDTQVRMLYDKAMRSDFRCYID